MDLVQKKKPAPETTSTQPDIQVKNAGPESKFQGQYTYYLITDCLAVLSFDAFMVRYF